ncbi:MAG: DNA polymerase III subunit gamma/tau [Aquificae bacterium]|nr:DNA polymerase III subunit gamma/tau [Aquificota bacterium]
MGYQNFARKYRPKDFTQVVGQEAIVKTLSNAIKLNRLSHAYIFAGSRGLGKTTTARILAKCLNCEKGITPEPCGKCENCVEIDKGSFPDLYEIDAASNRGIDDIRSIRDNVSYAPIKGRYKVYIIDEAHMLTREAFNALLKTLEEPPPNNLFILATTELHKIPETIRSRCQTFIFKPPTKKQIKEYLKRILQEENIPYEEEALDLIAEASEGGMRDAASLLDQAVIYSEGNLTAEKVRQMLGVIPEGIVKEFLSNLKEKDLKSMVKTIATLEEEGYDISVFWNQVLESVHNALINLTIEGKDPQQIFTEEDTKLLIYANDIFKKASLEAKNFQDKKDIYQLAVLKLKFIKNLIPLEKILEKGGSIPVQTYQKKEKTEEKGFNLQRALQQIKREAGGIVAGALSSATIKDEGNKIVINIDKNLADIVKDKIDIIKSAFGKDVAIEEIQIKKETKKTKKRDEAVNRIMELFNGKLITYSEGEED